MTTPANRYCTGCDLNLHLTPATTLNLQCIAFSIIAILANVPLMTNPLFGPHDPEDVNLVGVAGSDAEIINSFFFYFAKPYTFLYKSAVTNGV